MRRASSEVVVENSRGSSIEGLQSKHGSQEGISATDEFVREKWPDAALSLSEALGTSARLSADMGFIATGEALQCDVDTPDHI